MLYLIGGENIYQSSKRLEELKREFHERFTGLVKTFHADEVENPNEIFTDADSFTLFSQHKLILLKRVSSTNLRFREKVHDYLEKSTDTNFIIWEDKSLDKRGRLYKLVRKKGVVEEFSSPNILQLKTWLTKCLKDKTAFDTSCVDALILKIGNDQSQLALTVNNLLTLLKAENRRKLTLDDVNSLVTKTAEESIWEFVDAIGECKKARALEIMENLLKERNDFMIIVAMIARQFRIITLAKALLENGKNYAEIASSLKLHPFVIRKAVGHTKNFTLDQLRKLYQKLVRTDLVVKQGKFDEKLALDLLIAAL